MTLLHIALWVLAIFGSLGTARLAQEHHALRAAQIITGRIARRTRHDVRALFINPGRRVQGRDTPPAPRKAIAA